MTKMKKLYKEHDVYIVGMGVQRVICTAVLMNSNNETEHHTMKGGRVVYRSTLPFKQQIKNSDVKNI